MEGHVCLSVVIHCVETAKETEPFWKIPATDAADKKIEKEQLKLLRVRQDNKCRLVLVQSIADDYLEYVKDKKSPKEIWDGLPRGRTHWSINHQYIKIIRQSIDISSIY